jgi:hypothetical protein
MHQTKTIVDHLPIPSPLKAQSKSAEDHNLHLPGGKDHPILSLSQEELENTSIDELMSSYGESYGADYCANDYGNRLIHRWRDTKQINCPLKENSHLQSQIDCYLMHQNHHHGNGDNLCHYRNVAMNLGIFGDTSFTSKVIDNYVRTRHEKQAYPPFPKGFIQGDCEPNPSHWQTAVMPGWNADLTTKSYQYLEDASQVQCSVWIDHHVLMQERDTFANFFHDSEDFVNVFIAMAVLQWKPKDTQIYLMDLYPKGPFW